MLSKTVKIILAIALIGYTGMWAMYYFSLQNAIKQAVEITCKEKTGQAFRGQIVQVENYEYSDYMFGRYFNLYIRISDTSNYYLDYQYNMKSNEALFEFAKAGQSVIKLKGENTFTLVDTTGSSKAFKIADCDDVK